VDEGDDAVAAYLEAAREERDFRDDDRQEEGRSFSKFNRDNNNSMSAADRNNKASVRQRYAGNDSFPGQVAGDQRSSGQEISRRNQKGDQDQERSPRKDGKRSESPRKDHDQGVIASMIGKVTNIFHRDKSDSGDDKKEKPRTKTTPVSEEERSRIPDGMRSPDELEQERHRRSYHKESAKDKLAGNPRSGERSPMSEHRSPSQYDTPMERQDARRTPSSGFEQEVNTPVTPRE